jgi:hypothetical protein
MLDGAVALRGQLDEHGGAVLQSALAPLIRPLGPGDARTARQRRADALVELIAKAAADGHAGVENAAGLPPTLVVHVDVEQLADPSASALGVVAGGAQDADGAAPGCCDASPRPGGVVADLDWGGPILRQSLERIGCTAQIVRLVTAGGRRALDVGTASGSPPRRSGSPSPPATRAARSPAATGPQDGPTSTTCSPGEPADAPTSTTSSCYADTTTASSTKAAGQPADTTTASNTATRTACSTAARSCPAAATASGMRSESGLSTASRRCSSSALRRFPLRSWALACDHGGRPAGAGGRSRVLLPRS